MSDGTPIFVGGTWTSDEWDLQPVGGRIRTCGSSVICKTYLAAATVSFSSCYCNTGFLLAFEPENAFATLTGTKGTILSVNCTTTTPPSLGPGTPYGAYIIDTTSAIISDVRERDLFHLDELTLIHFL